MGPPAFPRRRRVMESNTRSSIALLAVLLAALPADTFAQDQPAVTRAQNQLAIANANKDAADPDKARVPAQKDQAKMVQDATKIDTGSRAKFASSAQNAWTYIQAGCTTNPITDQCAAAALAMASNECTASAKFVKKDA